MIVSKAGGITCAKECRARVEKFFGGRDALPAMIEDALVTLEDSLPERGAILTGNTDELCEANRFHIKGSKVRIVEELN